MVEEARPDRGVSGSDTVYALSSGFGRAAVAVIRVSGPAAARVTTALVGRLPPPRQAVLASLRAPGSRDAIDRALVVFFEGPKSFTGEDCVEFHVHGGPAVIAAMLQAFALFDGLRPAEPGEFTRRAFENGKLDLTEVEGIADLIEAQTEAQRRQAFRQMAGGLKQRADAWRSCILEASAMVAAEIDFADEGDVASRLDHDVAALIGPVLSDLHAELGHARAGERLHDGLVVVIAGPPNAGKSTLLNILARRPAAIVSATPGTTRDAIEVALDLDGVPLTLIDTAGLRASPEEIERIGMDLARSKAEGADLVLWLSEASAPCPPALTTSAEVWQILTKADLLAQNAAVPEGAMLLSAATGDNVDGLVARLAAFARNVTAQGQHALITRERHRLAIKRAAEALAPLGEGRLLPVEIVAEHLRAACRALESLVGRVDVEEVLGEIFARFCVGK